MRGRVAWISGLFAPVQIGTTLLLGSCASVVARGAEANAPKPPHWHRRFTKSPSELNLLPRAVINQDQAKCLVAHPDPHTSRGKRSRAILELLYGTGNRVSECERLDVSDVDLAQGVLFVRDGKGRKDRVVPVVGRVVDALDVYLRDARPMLMKDPAERALFLTRFGTRVRAKSIRYLVLMNRKGAEIPLPVTAHGLCHACATYLVKNGADVRHVQKLLGHASLTSTQIYTDVAAADLGRMLEKAHPRERAWKRKAARSGRKR